MITHFMRPKRVSTYNKKGKIKKGKSPERDWIATEKKYHKLVRTQKFKNMTHAQQKKKALWVLEHPINLKRKKGKKR